MMRECILQNMLKHTDFCNSAFQLYPLILISSFLINSMSYRLKFVSEYRVIPKQVVLHNLSGTKL